MRRDERLAAENLVIAAETGFLRWVLKKFHKLAFHFLRFECRPAEIGT